jgi:exonuclease III
MKLVTLNAWGGRQNTVFFDWVKEQSNTADIFCFQELYSSINPIEPTNINGVLHDVKQRLSETLPNFVCFYREHSYNASEKVAVDFDLSYGLATFVKKELLEFFIDEGDIIINGVNRKGADYSIPTDRNLQYLRLKKNGKVINILNIHGVWIANYGKKDHPSRDDQSENIIKFIKNLDGEVILTGDFNLLPHTIALKSIENIGLRNLITENNITCTRSNLYTKPNKYADYTLISSGINLVNFELPYTEASDHLPMITEIQF